MSSPKRWSRTKRPGTRDGNFKVREAELRRDEAFGQVPLKQNLGRLFKRLRRRRIVPETSTNQGA